MGTTPVIGKLGKQVVRYDAVRALHLVSYVKKLPDPPLVSDYSNGRIDWGMMGNDELGDCVFAMCAHGEQVVTQNTGSIVTVADSKVVEYYSQWGGYVIGNPATDNGAQELDVLNHWRKEGFDGHQLLAFVSVNPRDTKTVMQAITLFRGICIGLALPLSAQGQAVWDVAYGPAGQWGSWGGHAVYVLGYNKIGPVCITWGGLKQMTWAFFLMYCDEAYALLLKDVLGAFYIEDALDMDAMNQDLLRVAA